MRKKEGIYLFCCYANSKLNKFTLSYKYLKQVVVKVSQYILTKFTIGTVSNYYNHGNYNYGNHIMLYIHIYAFI